MAVEDGVWIMRGLSWNDPYRIRTWQELVNWINEVGFLPLFANGIEGFYAEEHVSPDYWWTGIREEDPWEWREVIASSHQVAYGKFFDQKAGFISLEWLPYFANYRRSGYDFDSRWEDGLANRREKKIMDMLTGRDEYGMPVSVLLPPEAIWGYETVTAAYNESPEASYDRITARIRDRFPGADEEDIIKLIGKKPN